MSIDGEERLIDDILNTFSFTKYIKVKKVRNTNSLSKPDHSKVHVPRQKDNAIQRSEQTMISCYEKKM